MIFGKQPVALLGQGCQHEKVGAVPTSLLQLLHHARGAHQPEVVVLAAWHAFLLRTGNLEAASGPVAHIAVQPSTVQEASLSENEAAGSGGQHDTPVLVVCCPAFREDDTIATHAHTLQAAVAAAPAQSMHAAGSFQAAVALEVKAASAAAASSGLGLALLLTQDDDNSSSLTADLVYAHAACSPEAARLMACHLQVFMSQLVHNDVSSTLVPLQHAPMMDQEEQQLVLKGFNQTTRPYDATSFVHGMFAEHVRRQPASPCVIFEDHVYSYVEVDAAANRIAHYLRNKAGATPGDIIGVLVLRSPLMVATLLAVFKCGCGYLPLDHHHPEARIAFMLEDAAVKAIVTQQELVHLLPSSDSLHTLLLAPNSSPKQVVSGRCSSLTAAAMSPESLGAAAEESPEWQLGQLGGPNSTCYIIYTSGSTGKPKGVVVLHKGLTAYTAWFRAHFGITSMDVFLQKTPTNFDASVDELWTALTAGATLVVAPPQAHRDVHSVMTLITRHGVTTASAVPSQVQMLAREILSVHSSADAAAGRPAPCASLRRVLSGGEALTTTMAGEVQSALPNCELHNTYGPTETTVGITSWLYKPPPRMQDEAQQRVAAGTIPIGRGIHNSRLYVLDPSLSPVPIGVPGQLFISGVQVAFGYLNRKDLTDEVFLANPFCEGLGTHTDRMYRTGDLVRWLPGQHACIEFLGRVDHQVKLRGFRIELQEVEAALGALQGVCQAVTALVKNPATEQDHLVAWISPATLEPVGLLQQLQGSLPEYMIPTAVVLMEQLPLLVSEKVDRKALPPPDFSTDLVSLSTAPAAQQGTVMITNPTRASSGVSTTLSESDPLSVFVSAVWAEVLGLQPMFVMGVSDDFFALGGNSLLAGKMNSTLRAGLSLPQMSGMLIYMHPTLPAFVAALSELDPLVPVLPAMGFGNVEGSDNGSTHSSYFASLRSASFTSLSSSVASTAQDHTMPSSTASFTSQSSGRSTLHISCSSPNLSAKASAFATAQQPPGTARLATVFSGNPTIDAVSGPAGSLLKQLSRGLKRTLSSPSKDQQLDTDLIASGLPVAVVPAGAAGNSFTSTLTRVLSTESLSLRTIVGPSAADADKLPISTSDSRKRASDSFTAKPSSFTFESPSKVDQEQRAEVPLASSKPVSRANSMAGAGEASQFDTSGGKQQQQVKPSLALATLVQLCSMCLVTGVSLLLGLAPMLISMYLMLEVGWRSLVLLPGLELCSWLMLALWSIGGKWLMVGRYKECEVPLWGSYYLRHWVAQLFILSARQSFIPLVRRTCLLNWFYRALGAKVDRNVVIDTDDLIGHDLIHLADDCILDASCGVSAITYEAGRGKGALHPLGTMRIRRVAIGERAVIGPNAMVLPGRVAPDSVVLPCSATSNPPSIWRGSSKPTFGPEGRAAVNTQDPALGVLAGLASMWLTSFLINLLSYPIIVGYWYFFQWLAGPAADKSASASSWYGLLDVSNTLGCWVHDSTRTAEGAASCGYLMQATLLAVLVLPATAFISGQLLVVLVVPFKWLLRSHAQPVDAAASACRRTWWQRFQNHLQQCIFDHPTVKAAAFLWTGTALFNAWLRALGTKVGRQAWIGEDLHLTHHELVDIGDTVSICSGVSLLPSAALGAAKITIHNGADVTNQTALYPGVTVKPGAVLGVFTYAEAGRTFPRYSITQGPMVLSPGQPDPVTPSKPSPSKPPRPPAGNTPLPSPSPPGSDYKTPLASPTIGPHFGSPAPSPKKTAPTATTYKTGTAAAADDTDPAEARLVSWGRYLRFNLCYITLMCYLMPAHAAMLSAPFAVVTVTLMFKLNWWAALLLAPAVSGLQLGITIAWMALLKRILLPRCRGSHPFYTYTHTAWMVEGLLLYYQQIGFVRYISGSQLAVWYYRALGAKIGQGVLLNGLHSQEPDCLTIGDGTVIDEMTFIQAHTVEQRCLKFHDVVVGSGVTIGCGSCVLPGCCIGDGAALGDVSLLMKGETMPPGSMWKGVPAVPCLGATGAARRIGA